MANLLETTTLSSLKGPLQAHRSKRNCCGCESGGRCDAIASDTLRQMLGVEPLTVYTEKSAWPAEVEI